MRGKPWTEDDEICARFLRHCGLSNKDIGAVLHRSTASIDGKLGYIAQRHHYAVNAGYYEAARPAAARQLGDLADNFQTVGNA